LKKAVPVPVIATASEAWREAIQTFFRFFAAFVFCRLCKQRQHFYLDCHVAPLLAMTASAFFNSLLAITGGGQHRCSAGGGASSPDHFYRISFTRTGNHFV